MTVKTCFAIGLVLLGLLPACSIPVPAAAPASNENELFLNVFAAASLTEAFEEIGKQFEALNPGLTVVFNFAGSQHLAQQLFDGAPADVFASANQEQMDGVVQNGRVSAATVRAFGKNQLVVIVPGDNPAGLVDLHDLAKPGLKLILAAKVVPAGQYSLDFFEKAVQNPAFGEDFRSRVLQNVVSYENNVKIVLTKIVLGEADAGIVYVSDIASDNLARVRQIEIPDALNVMATYPIAVVRDSPKPARAQAFVDYILSPAGQAVLEKYGFISVTK